MMHKKLRESHKAFTPALLNHVTTAPCNSVQKIALLLFSAHKRENRTFCAGQIFAGVGVLFSAFKPKKRGGKRNR